MGESVSLLLKTAKKSRRSVSQFSMLTVLSTPMGQFGLNGQKGEHRNSKTRLDAFLDRVG